jgi:pyridoxine 5-phosphate synthase
MLQVARMTKLSVNVNKIATLRNARGKDSPSLSKTVQHLLEWGVHGITVHPRPDERHVRKKDITILSEQIAAFNRQHNSRVEFNIEGYPSPDFLRMIENIQPDQCTLVPDPPEALTSNAGWDVVQHADLLVSIGERLRRDHVRCSLFVDPMQWSQAQTASLQRIAPERIELYTEAYADFFDKPEGPAVLKKYQDLANIAAASGIDVNAGHDLNLYNLAGLVHAIPALKEVSIGHALICDALYLGLEQTLEEYLRVLGWKPPT